MAAPPRAGPGAAVLLACGLLAGPVLAGPVLAEPPAAAPSSEDIKAHFILTTARFVTWPMSSFPEATQPIVFGVLGDEALALSLETMLAGRTFGGRALRLQRVRDVAGALACHVLFFGRDAAGDSRAILDRLRKRAILTVSDEERFARQGGILSLRLAEGMVQFEVNLDGVRRAGLEISSKILRIGAVVRDRNQEASSR